MCYQQYRNKTIRSLDLIPKTTIPKIMIINPRYYNNYNNKTNFVKDNKRNENK